MDSIKRKQRLKKLLDTGREIRSMTEVEDNIKTIGEISKIIKETDLLDKEADPKYSAENTTEVVMNAQVIKMSHELVGEVMQKMGNSEFSDEEFINSIKRIVYGDNDENWNALAEIATRVAKTWKFSSCLLGSFKLEPNEEKVAKERRKRSKKELAAEERPEEVSKLNKQEKGYQKVNLVLRRIKALYEESNHTPIPLYKLIIDPDDFMCTADNGFQVAFLARDGSVAVEKGSDGYPTIRPTSKHEKSELINKPETVQAICSLNPIFCKEMVTKYKIREPLLIINREETDESTRAGNCSQRR